MTERRRALLEISGERMGEWHLSQGDKEIASGPWDPSRGIIPTFEIQLSPPIVGPDYPWWKPAFRVFPPNTIPHWNFVRYRVDTAWLGVEVTGNAARYRWQAHIRGLYACARLRLRVWRRRAIVRA